MKKALFIILMTFACCSAVCRQSSSQPQIRALWVDAVPGHAGLKTPAQVDQLIADARGANINTLFAQVWRQGGALFLKTTEPRYHDSALQPNFDVLQYLIEKAHAEGIELHAWINACSLWRDATLPSAPHHAYNLHGTGKSWTQNWLSVTDSAVESSADGVFLDPGNPAAADYMARVYLSVVQNYEVDGIHFDFIRYAGQEWGYNRVSVARYKHLFNQPVTPPKTEEGWMQWRRDQVTALVRRVYLSALALKPRLKVSAATIAFGRGPIVESDWQRTDAYTSVFQDWRAWTQEGILDFPVVMNYDRETDANQKQWFDQWIEWDKNHRYNRHLVIGQGAFLNSVEGSLSQTRRALLPSAVTGNQADGVCFFAYASTNNVSRPNEDFYTALTATVGGQAPLFASPVITPPMDWKTNPQTGHLLGKVTYANGAAVDHATVVIAAASAAQSSPLLQKTDGNGYYGAVDLAPQSYALRVELEGRTVKSDIAFEVKAGQVTPVHITLDELPVPVITLVTYAKKRLTIEGFYFAGNAEVRVNGRTIQREILFENNTLVIRGKAKHLNINNLVGGNVVAVIVDGKLSASVPF